MPVVTREAEVVRYFVRESFNPASHKQLLAYMGAKGFRGGTNPKSKSGGPSVDKAVKERLARKDPLFAKILEWDDVAKIKSTQVDPCMGMSDARIHYQFLHKPSTQRLSAVGFNIQNVPDDEFDDALPRMFRHCVVAEPGCLLVEADFGSIEGVLTGYFMDDPDYMRLAKMGIHSYVLAAKLGEPADKTWPDDRLAAYLAQVKAAHKDSDQYHGCKRGVHLTNYGGSPMMMHKAEPKVFPTLAAAKAVQGLYFELVPKLPAWQHHLRERAAAQHFLGGNDHPFRYKHWFWDVVSWDPRRQIRVPGRDWNRVVAYYPQSTAAGVLFEAVLRLVDPDSPFYVADLYHGLTPLRALIHDSILAEVPINVLDRYAERLVGSMTQPVPELGGLVISVDVKVGRDWGSMKPLRKVA
jgi:hypothetical protein